MTDHAVPETDADPNPRQWDEMTADTERARPLVPVHPRRRWPWLVAVGAVAVAAGVTAALLALSGHGLTPACQAAVDRQNQFVTSAVADGYPDGLTISQYMAIQAADLRIINDALKVCPADTTIKTLPDAS